MTVCLDTLQLWETANKMEFHPGKCEMLRITNITKPNQNKTDYKIHSTTTTLVTTNAAEYLEITIDPSLQWNKHQHNSQSKFNTGLPT